MLSKKAYNESYDQKQDELRVTAQEHSITDIKMELAMIGSWEYWTDTNFFEFRDEFYTIYSTNMAKEGRFLTLETYIREFVHPEDVKIAQEQLINLLKLQVPCAIEFRIIRRDGAIRTINVWRVSRDDSDAKKIYGVIQDVTESKNMEEEFRSSRKKLSAAAKLANIGPWEYDTKNRLFEFSDEFYAVYGTTVAKEGRFMTPEAYFREFVHPADAKMVEGVINSISPTPSPTSYQHRIIRRDGLVRTIEVYRGIIKRDADGNIEKIYGANQDITERIVVENALRESKDRQKATLNAMPDMLLRMDALGNLFDYRIPEQYSSYLARSGDAYNSIDDLLPNPLAKLVKKLVTTSLRLGETKMANYSGVVNDVIFSYAIRTATINKKQALVIIQDQTVLYRAQREVQRLENLNLIGEMAASIGHELRNPLTTVRGYLQFLSRKEQFKNQLEMFQVMIGEIDQANSIITEFLTLAKNKAVNREPTNINNLINAIYPLLEVEAASDNKIICLELESELPDLYLDKGEFRQMFINLVRNGLEAMSGNGKLTITTSSWGQDVTLSVRDEGPGIPDTVIENIGIPFITTKDNSTGLGLSICYSIAARNNAIIDFTTGSEGTEFVVRFIREKFE